MKNFRYSNKDNKDRPRKTLKEVKERHNFKKLSTDTERKIAEMLKKKYDEVREGKLKSNTYIAVRKGDKWGFVDRKGEECFKIIYDEVKDYDFEWYVPVKLNGKWGLSTFQTRNGENVLIFPCEYEDFINMYDNTFAFKQKGKWGVMDIEGNILIPCEYDDASFFRWGDDTLKLKKKGKRYEINPRSSRDIKASLSKYKKGLKFPIKG